MLVQSSVKKLPYKEENTNERQRLMLETTPRPQMQKLLRALLAPQRTFLACLVLEACNPVRPISGPELGFYHSGIRI